jgi:methionyl-tRNA formyltransferase
LCEDIKDSGSDVVMIISLSADNLPENSFDFKDFSRLNKIKLFLTEDINNKETEQFIKTLNPDFLVVA